MKKQLLKILVVCAHPDDEVLGCGGTIARLSKEGCLIYTLILGEGISSRYKKQDLVKKNKEIRELKNQATKANKTLGVKDLYVFDFPDNKFDTVPLLDIIKTIEKIKVKLTPNIIFTHSAQDLNIDHQIVYRAVITATRPMKGETIKEIYSFEVLSSTEWNYPLQFSPDVFFNISDFINIKLKAMKEYKNELRKFPHPRSLKAIKTNAQSWGYKVGCHYAEAFKAVRLLK